MGKNKTSASLSSSNANDPLEIINKAVRTLKFADESSSSSSKSNNDDDEDKKQKFHQLNRTLIDKSVKESRIYKPLDSSVSSSSASASKNNKNYKQGTDELSSSSSIKIIVENLDTLAAVVNLSKNENFSNPAVLVFASDTNPGGSKSASNAGTQEEAIVRTSTLSVAQRQLPYPIPDFGVAYVPWCQTILPKDGAFTFGAVCAALRNFMSDTNSGKFTQKEKEFLHSKIMSVLLCGLQNGHTSIVLGSWGGGAFSAGTDDYLRLVAEGFADCIEKLMTENASGQTFYQRIVFAIPTAAKKKIYEKVFYRFQ